jgi:hypothetical protein
MIYNSKYNKIILNLGYPLWLIVLIGLFIGDYSQNIIIINCIHILLIFLKVLIIYVINPKIIKTKYKLLIPNLFIIIITSVLIGISYNSIVNKFTSQFEKILFIVGFGVWLLSQISTLIYDIQFIYNNEYGLRLP